MDQNVRIRDVGGKVGASAETTNSAPSTDATLGTTILGNHEKAIRKIVWNGSSFISGGWDGSILTWDVRKKGHVSKMVASDRVFALDARDNIVVSGNGDGNISHFDLRMPNAAISVRPSSLGHQIRCVKIFDSGTGLLSGSIEGRVAVENLQVNAEDADSTYKRFTFKCHRMSEKEIYPVNTICTHSKNQEKFLSGGGDGTVSCWDASTKEKDFDLPRFSESIASISCSANADWLAVASSYGFERGADTQGKPPMVSLFQMNF